MNTKQHVMLGFDFTGSNFPSALYTMQQWAKYTESADAFQVSFGVSTASYQSRGLPGASDISVHHALVAMLQYCPSLACWDECVTDIASQIISDIDGIECKPFYSSFNYGSLDNRLLLLAHTLRARFLIRVDPSTLPPKTRSFDELVAEHIGIIGNSDIVVSRGYDGRLAIRGLFVTDKEKHEKLIEQFTGINPLKQVTGGAMLTSSVPGVPAIPFERFGGKSGDLTLVWGSDDAIYQIIKDTNGSKKLESIPIPRFDQEGKRKSTIEYYRGILGMVYLSGLLSKNDSSKAQKARLNEFFNLLKKEHLSQEKYRSTEKGATLEDEFIIDNVAPSAFLTKIEEGLMNYKLLICESQKNWQLIANILQGPLYPHVQIR